MSAGSAEPARSSGGGGQEIVLFHSLLGLRPGVLQWAARLRSAGHTVHTPDLYDGLTFDTPAAAAASPRVQEIGFDGVLARAAAAVADLPGDVVYAGFSNGAACAELLAATRAGARGAILMHAPLPIRALGWRAWPATVPVQVHFGEKDPLRSRKVIDDLAVEVRRSGAAFDEHVYPECGHIFSDPDLPSYREAAAETMLQRVLEFLERATTR